MGGEGGKEGECEEESLTATVSRQARAGKNTDFTEWVDLNDLAINPKNPMSCSSWQILFKLEKKDCHLCDFCDDRTNHPQLLHNRKDGTY